MLALLIGINEYRDKSIPNLTGATADCDNMEIFLRTNLEEVHIVRLRNEKATRKGIEKAINDLANDNRISFDDPILIYYAGHGGEIGPPKAWKVPDGTSKIQMILPHDFIYQRTQGSNEGQGLLDGTLRELLEKLSICKGDNIVSVCFSEHQIDASSPVDRGYRL